MKKIFVLHGWTYTADRWHDLLKELTKAGLTPLMLPIPSLTEKTDRVWTLDSYVEWLHNIVEKEKEPIILLGHSNGGRIALAFAAKYPKKVERLLLIDSAGIYHNELPLRLKRMVFGKLARIGKKISSSKNARNLLYKLIKEHDYNSANELTKQTMQNLITTDITYLLPTIVTPTLLIWGRHDKKTPLVDGEKMLRLLPHATLHVIETARHSPQFTHTKDVVEKILSTLE